MKSLKALQPNRGSSPDVVNIVSGGKVNRESSLLDELSVIRNGLPVNTVRHLGTIMLWNKGMLAKHLHTTTKTLERCAKDNKPLNSQISESALDIAKLTDTGLAYFGSIERWRLWLNTPNMQFHNEKPSSVIDIATGRNLIRRIIRGLEYGFAA
ncbi:antitoxin Xre/MbcA/ParS toxin-binding domain-containing protein [Alteromonas sp. CYL-A6]|uniref:antitoxin Xre/MbcA/ParS toxin-binding domain-containing protein n=1 Tax=Alteromonas nitratireducens TaxID=3390813 RepID=UPI0034A98D3A